MTSFATSAPFDRVSGNLQNFTKALSAAVVAGSPLWCLTEQYHATNTCDSVTDDLGGTWVKAFGPVRADNAGGASNATIYGWYKLNSAAGGTPTNGTITAHWSAAAQGTMAVGEVRGLTGGGALAAAVAQYVSGAVTDISFGVTPSLPVGAAGVMMAVAPGSAGLATPHSPLVVDSSPDGYNYERLYRTIIASAGAVDAGLTINATVNVVGGAMFFKDALPPTDLTGNITADDAAPTGSIAPTPPSGLSGNLSADDAVASGALSPVVSSVTTLPASRNPGNGARLVSIANVALAVLTDDANLARLNGSASLNMDSDGRLAFANGVPVPAGTSVVVVTRLPGANGALGIERYITA